MFPDITLNSRTPRSSRRRPTAGRYRIAIVASRFNEFITSRLAQTAVATLRRYGCHISDEDVLWCPGAFELPLVADRLAAVKRWDAIICLGAVIRGETPHFEYVSAEAARGIQEVALRRGLPVVFGVLTTNTIQQARARAGGRHGNKGADAAETALDMIELLQRLKGLKRR